MRIVRDSFVVVLAVASTAFACAAFGTDDSGKAVGPDPGASTAGKIALRGKAQFPLQPGNAVVLASTSDTAPDDMIWVSIGVTLSSDPAAVKAPPGFTPRGSRRVQGPGICHHLDIAYFSRRAEGSGAATYTFDVSATASSPAEPYGVTGILVQYSGVDPVQPIDDEAEGILGAEAVDGGPAETFVYTPPTLNTVKPNALLLYLLGDQAGARWTDPDVGPARVTDTNVLAAFSVPAPTAGKTAPQRFLISSPLCGVYTRGQVKVVALRPAN